MATGPDAAGDSAQPAFDLQQVHGFADNRYVYLLLETAAPPDAEVQVTISLDALGEDPVPRLVASASGAVIERPGAPSEVLRDVALGTGSAIELRLPHGCLKHQVVAYSAPGRTLVVSIGHRAVTNAARSMGASTWNCLHQWGRVFAPPSRCQHRETVTTERRSRCLVQRH